MAEVFGWSQEIHKSAFLNGASEEALRALGYNAPGTQAVVPYWPLTVQRALLPAAHAAFLADVAAGRVSRSRLEVVMVRRNEDIGWASELLPVTTVYNRGERLPASKLRAAVEVVQPNLGRESSAYLTHIIAHYDSLAEVTVFTHASVPSTGFRTSNGGGHLQAGGSIYDYVLADPGSEGGYFSMTDVVSLLGESPRQESLNAGGAFTLHLPRWGTALGPVAHPPRCFDPTHEARWKHRTPAVVLGPEAADDCRRRTIKDGSVAVNSSEHEVWAAALHVHACTLAASGGCRQSG